MPTNPTRAAARLRLTLLAMLGVLWLPFAAMPVDAQDLAGSPVAVGVPAQITYTNGQDILLRAAPGYDQTVVNGYGEGTPVEVVEGPVTASDGSSWFGVTVYGESGYLPAGHLTAAGPPPAPVDNPAPAPAETTTATTQAPPAAQPAAAPATGAYATADLNLRAGPNATDPVLLVIPGGASLATTGEASNGYLGVVYQGQTGWADGAYIGAGAPATDSTLATTDPATASGYTGAEQTTATQPAPAPADTTALISDPAAAPAGTAASVTVLANLRGGPSEADPVLRVLPVGSPVTITGEATNGYVPVWYNGTAGWLSTQAIAGGQPATTAQPAPAPSPAETTPATGARTTLEAVNVRAEPTIGAAVIGVIPGGVALTPTAGPESGFYQVSYDGVSGWVSGASLGDGAASAEPASAYGPAPGLEPEAPRGGGLIWPVTGGNWRIMQGYNGSSHQDNSSTYQYYYSLDLVRSDGNTAGQPVLAPTAGTVRWLDPSTGGISIDIGNGHAVAMFHVAVDPSLRDGTPVQQGQVIGHISGRGEPGFAGTPHLHFALWATTDGGNWSRDSVPFTGAYALAGQEFPDIGGSNQHRGTEISV